MSRRMSIALALSACLAVVQMGIAPDASPQEVKALADGSGCEPLADGQRQPILTPVA